MAIHNGLCKNKRKRKQGKKASNMSKQRRALLERRADAEALPVRPKQEAAVPPEEKIAKKKRPREVLEPSVVSG